MVTDGRLGDLENINIAVNRLHETNIYSQVYAIGVNRADYNEVELIAGNGSPVFFTFNFDSNTITSLQQNVTQMLKPCVRKFLIT